MINIIVAISRNNVIGNLGSLPWHYPEDLQYFKKITLNQKVLMGKTTFNSIVQRLGKPLPQRHNIVVTHDQTFSYPGVEVVHDLTAYLQNIQNEDIFIIGGKQIYEQCLPYAHKLYITFINKEYQGDTYFPSLDLSSYQLISRRDSQELSFCIYEKVM